jgi:hypothetical protein
MTRAAQKDEELFYADEFVRQQLNLDVVKVKPAAHEPPDCSAIVSSKDGTTTLLDLELAEYYVDQFKDGVRGSLVRRVGSWWEKVCASLDPQIEAQRLPVLGSVRFKEPVLLKNAQVSNLSNELIRFAQESCPRRHLERTCHTEFSPASYPLLNELVERVYLTYLKGTVAVGWHCSNTAAANIGVDTSHLADLVRRKTAKNFTWRSGAEKCLLIYASGAAVTSGAGPLPPDPSIWDDRQLIAACGESVFDRIYFWERVRKWHKRLK